MPAFAASAHVGEKVAAARTVVRRIVAVAEAVLPLAQLHERLEVRERRRFGVAGKHEPLLLRLADAGDKCGHQPDYST